MKTLGIIGTAGRGYDGAKMSKSTWDSMTFVCEELIKRTKPDGLVSGGAAWSDHLAVQLYLQHKDSLKLKLFLPVKFNSIFNESEIITPYNCGIVLNHYHRLFGKAIGIDTLKEIQSVLDDKIECVSGKGFHGRNSQIAQASDDILAFTFGNGENLKDGGTKDTWDKFMKKENRGHGYHYNLSNNKIYKIK